MRFVRLDKQRAALLQESCQPPQGKRLLDSIVRRHIFQKY